MVAGLFILKHMHNLSDEVLCARWLENPYYQFFCGELSFCHSLPFDRSSLTHWRQRLGEEQLVALIQESLSVAHKTGALSSRDLERVVVDTTVQPKAVAHPTDARLCHRALEKLVDLARRHHVPLRQSYRRLAKRAAIMVGRYTHAHQFKRARRALKFLRIRLGRVIRDIRRKIAGNKALERHFADLLALAVRVRVQDHRQRGPKVYALHAPEVECIGKGKARAPYEFGCKVSVATPASKPKGGQFVLHAKALHGNPFDGHTLGPVIAELEATDRDRDPPHPRRQGLSRPQPRPEVPRLDQRPGAPRHRPDPPRDAPPCRGRAGHWAYEGRAPDGPQLPQRPRRRPHQCRPRRRRLQLRSAPALAREAFACLATDVACSPGASPKCLKNAHPRFFTDDHLGDQLSPAARLARVIADQKPCRSPVAIS
jgi:hypothetical protein